MEHVPSFALMPASTAEEMWKYIAALRQWLTLVHFSAQHKPFGHLLVSTCLIDWGTAMHQTYPTNRANVQPKSERV